MLAESQESLQNLLTSWGRFWASRETCGGNARTSIQWRMMEAKRLGINSRGTKHLYDLADEIHVPAWVQDVDVRVATLPAPAKIALRLRYISYRNDKAALKESGISRKRYYYWLGVAHSDLMVS